MILKSLTAALVSMTTAGAVVYFGTTPEEAGAHPHKTETKLQDKMRETERTKARDDKADGSESATSRVVVTAESERDSRTSRMAEVKGAELKPSTSWREKYMKLADEEDTKTLKAQDGNMPERTDKTHSKTPARTMPHLDDPEKGKGAMKERPEEGEVRTFTFKRGDVWERDDNPESMRENEKRLRDAIARKTRESGMDVDESGNVTEESLDLDHKDGKTVVRRKIMRIDSSGNVDEDEMEFEVDLDNPSDADIDRILGDIMKRGQTQGKVKMAEAYVTPLMEMPDGRYQWHQKADPDALMGVVDDIQDDDLKDQALYSIATYALRFDDFETAKTALEAMGQEELMATTRSRVAFRYAELGKMEKALAEIAKIEDEELRDVVRVQLVETLTRPVK